MKLNKCLLKSKGYSLIDKCSGSIRIEITSITEKKWLQINVKINEQAPKMWALFIKSPLIILATKLILINDLLKVQTLLVWCCRWKW